MVHRRTLLTLSIVVLTLLALAPATPAAAAPAAPASPGYLALGDSVAFGFNPLALTPTPPFDPRNPANFVGYPEVLAQAVPMTLANASCPGETSASLYQPRAVDNGCDLFRANLPLHVDYSSGVSPILPRTQLNYALAYLRAHPNTSLITIDIGSNDLFLLRAHCTTGNVLDVACVNAGLPTVLSRVAGDLTTIYALLRLTGHFRGTLVALTYYVTDYSDPAGVAAIMALNQVVAQVTRNWGGLVADGFGAFYVASAPAGHDPCAAGLLIPLGGGVCDIHPSLAGQQVLAAAIRQALGK